MASAKNQSLSINMVMNSAIRGSNFLQVSVNKLHKYSSKLQTINILKATKFPVLNRHVESLNKNLQKTQSLSAKISRQPLTSLNAKQARDDLKERLRLTKAIGKYEKQASYHQGKRAGISHRAGGYVGSKVKMGAGIAMASATGAVMALNPVRKAIDFETSMADVTKATNATKAQRLKLKQNILSLVQKGSIFTPSQIAQIQAGGGRSGVSIKNLPRFTTDIFNASVAMDLSTDESGSKFAKMAERMDLPISKINILTNAFTHLENNGANAARDMINTTGRLAGIFKELHFSPQNSAAISNYMNTLEVSPELAATSFKILNNRFKKTNSKYHYFSRLQKKGAGELKNIILDISKTMSKQQIMKVFGAQGANVITKMSGDLKHLDKSLSLVAGNKFMNAVGNEVSVKMATSGAKEQMAKNRIIGGSIVLGDKFKNQYVSFLNALSNGVTTVSTFYSENEKLIKSVGGLALKVVGFSIAMKGIMWVASPFWKMAKGAWKLKGALSALSLASKSPIKLGVTLPGTSSVLGKFKSFMSVLFSFAKRNPIIIGATLATGAVMAGLNHMAKNSQTLAKRQTEKGVGLALQVKPVNSVDYDPNKKIGSRLKKGFSLADQLNVNKLPVESPSMMAQKQIAEQQAKQVTNNNMQQTHVTNNVTINNQGGKLDQHEFDRAFQTKLMNDKHHASDVTFNDPADVAS